MGKPFSSSVLAVQWFQVARYGAGFLLSIWLVKLFPDKTLISQYETLMLTSASLSFFWLSGLYDAFIPLYRKSSDDFQRTLMVQVFRTGILFAFLTASGTWLVCSLLHPDISGAATTSFSIYVFFHTGSYTLEHAWIARSRKWELIFAGPAYFVCSAMALGIPLTLGWGLESALICTASVAGLRFLVQLILQPDGITAPLRLGAWLPMLRISFPVMLAVLLGGGTVYLDSNLVRYSVSGDEFVNYTYGAREFPLALLLANSLSLVKSGEIAAARGKEQLAAALASLRRSSLRVMHIVFPLAVVLLLISAPLITWLLRPIYKDAYIIFDISLLLVIPRMLFPQSIVKAYLKGWVITWISLAELLLNLILCVVLMQFWGTAGVAAGALIAATAEKVFLAIYCRTRLGISAREYTPVYIWTGYSVLLLGIYTLKLSTGFFN